MSFQLVKSASIEDVELAVRVLGPAGAVTHVHDVGLIALTLAKTGACRPIPIVG